MRALIALALAAPVIAHAQPASDAPAEPPAPTEPPAPPPPPADDAPTTKQLAEEIEQLRAQVKDLEDKQAQSAGTEAKVESMWPRYRFITAYIDVGAFVVGGNGSGIRSDVGHFFYPKYAGRIAGQWVFMGDPLATAINSLGEPADTSDSRELKTDPIHSGGRPTMLVNSLALALGRSVSNDISIAALVELLPRPGENILDIELAQIHWRPIHEVNLEISAGKIDSVLGVEYRAQDANRRLEITPSLIARYTTGRPVGIQARLVRGPLSASAAITDRDNFADRFEPSTSLTTSWLPTIAGHLQYSLPVGQNLELGVSAALGPQTDQPDTGVAQWHVGFDAKLTDLHGFDATAEYVQGLQQGQTTTITPCNAAPCLSYKGAYLIVDHRMNNWFTPYVRVDWRDAVHQNGVQFVYESHTARATIGGHFELSNRIIGKIEYSFVRELDVIPDFPDDVLTTSIVVATD